MSLWIWSSVSQLRRVNLAIFSAICQCHKDSTEVWCASGLWPAHDWHRLQRLLDQSEFGWFYCEKFSCILNLTFDFTYKLQQMEGFGVPCWRMAPSDHVHVPYEVFAVSLGFWNILEKWGGRGGLQSGLAVAWSQSCEAPIVDNVWWKLLTATSCLCTISQSSQEHQCGGILQWQSGMALSIL